MHPRSRSGPSPFALPPIAVLNSAAAPVLVVSDDEAEPATATGCEVATYPGFGIGPLDPVGAAVRALTDVLSGSRIAIDAGTLPAALAAGLDWVDVGGRARAGTGGQGSGRGRVDPRGDRRVRRGPAGGAGPRGCGDHGARAVDGRSWRDGERSAHPAAGSGRSRRRSAHGGDRRPAEQSDHRGRRPRALRPRSSRRGLLGRLVRDLRGRRARRRGA